MGHAIDYITVENKKEIMAAAWDFAYYNTDREENPDGDYHGRMTIHEDKICDNLQDAIEFIRNKDNGWYDDHAVRFYNTDELKDTAHITKLKERIRLNDEKKLEYIEKSDVKNQKAKFITCPKCESKVNKTYIRNSKCPICNTSLLSNTAKDRIAKFKEDNTMLQRKIKELQAKNKKKAKICWCVKVEVHC